MAVDIHAAESSHIEHVTLYPGVATIERVAEVQATATSLEVSCLPPSFNVQSVRMEAPVGIELGESHVRTMDGIAAEACHKPELQQKIDALTKQRMGLVAERDANDIAATYLKTLSTQTGSRPDGKASGLPDAKAIQAATEGLKRNAMDLYTAQARLKQRIDEMDKAIDTLTRERDRTARGDATDSGPYYAVTVGLGTHAAGSVHMSYQIKGPTWSPAYRAQLDTAKSEVLLTRQALLSQASGEDWHGVKLTLSTGQPDVSPYGHQPASWELDVAHEVPDHRATNSTHAAQTGNAIEKIVVTGSRIVIPLDAGEEDATITTQHTGFSTVYDIPGVMDLASNGEKISVPLAQQRFPVSLSVAVSPERESFGYLTAKAARPEGVWPAGNLQIQRDGAFVGSTQWYPARGELLEIPFGRDDLIQVKVDRPTSYNRSVGLIGGRNELAQGATYTVRNQHNKPINLRLVVASPVSKSDQISVTSLFDPKPTTERYDAIPGMTAWETALQPGETQKFSAQFTITYAKDVTVVGLHDD